MRQETRKLLDYIISVFGDRRITGDFPTEEEVESVNRFNEKQSKIQAFLRSIPDIEKHLTEGGYIQDRNGTPICHGDKINVYDADECLSGTYKQAVLNWNPRLARFEVIYENNYGLSTAVPFVSFQTIEKEV
jgi:hypothetical protein